MSTSKKKSKKVPSEVVDPLSSSGVSSLSGISSYNIRKISIFKNGDRFHRGVKFVINPRVIKDLEPLLNQINDRIELSHGVKKLFTSSGKAVKSIKDLEDGKVYVAASSQFIPMSYGGAAEKVWKPPSRKHSPIFREDRIRTSRTRSQEPRQRQVARAMAAENEVQKSASSVVRSRSVRTFAEDRKSRKDELKNGRGAAESTKKVVQRRIAPPMVVSKSPVVANRGAKSTLPLKKPPVPNINRKSKPKPKTPKPKTAEKKPDAEKPVQTAVSVAASECPPPNVASSAAEILEFPEERKVVNVERIHRTPTPPKSASSAKMVKSVSADHSAPHSDDDHEPKSESVSGSENEETEDDEEESASEDDGSKGEKSGEEDGDNEEESVGTDSEVETPSSRKSSSAVSSGEESEKNEENDKATKDESAEKKVTSAESGKK